ncbi:MAG TPA: HPr family phosphocarrier protein [Ktedonobacteraceae bacterium]|nr:HPr family phosphocarrier protein [Ktedonobacteraceae bacterium]
MATSNEVVVSHNVGLHARPAAVFAKLAATFSSTIQVENLTKGTEPVNAKSVLRILAAGIQMNDRLRISADGTDEDAAITALSNLITTNFGETE